VRTIAWNLAVRVAQASGHLAVSGGREVVMPGARGVFAKPCGLRTTLCVGPANFARSAYVVVLYAGGPAASKDERRDRLR